MCRQLMVITVFIAFLNLLRKCLIPWVTVFVAAFPKIMGQSIIAGGHSLGGCNWSLLYVCIKMAL